jgi:hypothetical protein
MRIERRKRKDIGHQHIPPAVPRAADILASAMLAQHGPVPEISITFDPATRCYGFSTRLPGMRPHWMIDTFTSLEDVMRWVDPWRERVWEEPATQTKVGYSFRGAESRGRTENGWRRFGRPVQRFEAGFPDSSLGRLGNRQRLA